MSDQVGKRLFGVIKRHWIVTAGCAVSGVIGIAGLPDDATTWAEWIIAIINSDLARWLFLIGAVAVFAIVLYRDRIIPPIGRWLQDRASIEADLMVLTGVRNQVNDMLKELDQKKVDLTPEAYAGHIETVFVAAGNGIQRARDIGTFDNHIDLLIILDGVEKQEYVWQTGNLARDRFHGFWYWFKKKMNDPGHEERGDYQPYVLKKLMEFLDARIVHLKKKLGD